MKTIKVSFEISEERFLECLNLAGEDLGLELSTDLDMDKLVMEFNEDVAGYIVQDLTGFFGEGLNQDLYQDYFNWKDEEEDEDEFTVI